MGILLTEEEKGIEDNLEIVRIASISLKYGLLGELNVL